MKKIVCLVLTLLLCLNVAAVAENVPSKTVGDLTQIDVVAENMPENAGMFVEPVNMTDPEYRELIEV